GYNDIRRGSPSDQPHVAHGALVLPRTEGPRRSNGPLVIAVRKFCRKTLSSDQRMRKIDSVRNRVFVSWVHSNEFIAFASFDFPPNSQICSRPPLCAHARLQDHLHEREGTAIQNGP